MSQVEDIATCIGCGCTDLQACTKSAEPCHWLDVDYAQGIGVCSECPGKLPQFNAQTCEVCE